jgi:hypothetical protein
VGGSYPIAVNPAPSPAVEKGTLRLAMTDAPACGYDAIHVTVTKVRVHQSATAAVSEAGWQGVIVKGTVLDSTGKFLLFRKARIGASGALQSVEVSNRLSQSVHSAGVRRARK